MCMRVHFVWVCLCAHSYVCTCMCECVNKCSCMRVCKCVCARECTRMCVCMYACVWVCVHAFMCMCGRVRVCLINTHRFRFHCGFFKRRLLQISSSPSPALPHSLPACNSSLPKFEPHGSVALFPSPQHLFSSPCGLYNFVVCASMSSHIYIYMNIKN